MTGTPPSDFGLSPLETLTRVADPTPSRDHQAFWSRWVRRVAEVDPRLTPRTAGGIGAAEIDPSDDTATHGLASLGGVRLGARIREPSGRPRAVIVTTHGYGASLALAERDGVLAACVERGVAVVHLRVRGYAGSRLDCGDLTAADAAGLGWICRGLDEPEPGIDGAMAWSYVGACADLAVACLAARRWLEERGAGGGGLYLHGESFGGGLATVAAAMLGGRPGSGAGVDRLVLALPTMGDWAWRHAHPAPAGSGEEIRRLLGLRPALAGEIRERLRLADSALHAARIRCPVLCKLALRDEVVPAPSAAAVFNALGVDPGCKWRFVVPVGHAEAGVANARRHAEFERCAADFFDPALAASAAMRPWEPRLAGMGDGDGRGETP